MKKYFLHNLNEIQVDHTLNEIHCKGQRVLHCGQEY